MREERGQPAIDDMSPCPDGWKGISFTIPRSEEKQQELADTIKDLRFSLAEFKQYHGRKGLDSVPGEKREGAKVKCGNEWPGQPIQKWDDISISFVSDSQVRVETSTDDIKLIYAEMGMADGRNKDVPTAPWYHLGPEYVGNEGDRINDHHLSIAEKQAARKDVT